MNIFNIKEEPKKTRLRCPISGDILIAEPVVRHVRDSSHFYYAENHKEYRYERHPFSWNLFRRVYGGTRKMGSKALQYFRLNDDDSWTEMIQPEGFDDLVEIGTSEKEIKKLIKEQKKKKKQAEKDYQERLANGLPTLPIAIKFEPKSIAMELVSVHPMAEPTGLLETIDVVYSTEKEISYPYIVTADIIEEVKSYWPLEKYDKYKEFGDIQIGDVIDEWKHGGALSMRMGEMIVRDGIEIYSRLTAMS